jgi:hypothetical protein
MAEPSAMQLDRARLKAKLDSIPEAEREPYLLALKAKGYTWKTEAPAQGGILHDLTTRDLEGAPKTDPLAQAARLGQFANKGNQALAGIVAEQTGQREAKRAAEQGDALELPVPKFLAGGQPGHTIQAGALPGVAAAGTLATASEFALPQTRLGVLGYAVAPAMKAYQALRGAAKVGGKPGVVAQLGQSRTKVPAGDLQQAIDDPTVFDAPSVKDANTAYGAAAGKLKSAARSLRQSTGKVLLGEADWNEAINRPGRILAGTETAADGSLVQMEGQTALEGVQSINRFMRNKVNTAKLDKEQIAELLTQKESLLSWLENNGTPGMRGAAKVLRKAHVKENLSKIMPQNKYGGTDALRTTAAGLTGTAAVSAAAGGYPLVAAPLALEAITASPAFWGGAIRNYHTLSNPNVTGNAAAIAALRARRSEK